MMNDNSNFIQEGGNVTHKMEIKVSQPVSCAAGNQIGQALHDAIVNTDFDLLINGVQVTIRWRTLTTRIGHYDAFIPMFTDVVVDTHVRLLLTRLVGMLQTAIPDCFDANTGVMFWITKPIAITPQAIPPRFVRPPVVEG